MDISAVKSLGNQPRPTSKELGGSGQRDLIDHVRQPGRRLRIGCRLERGLSGHCVRRCKLNAKNTLENFRGRATRQTKRGRVQDQSLGSKPPPAAFDLLRRSPNSSTLPVCGRLPLPADRKRMSNITSAESPDIATHLHLQHSFHGALGIHQTKTGGAVRSGAAVLPCQFVPLVMSRAVYFRMFFMSTGVKSGSASLSNAQTRPPWVRPPKCR